MKIFKITYRGLDDGCISEIQLNFKIFEPLSIGSLKFRFLKRKPSKIINKATGNERIEFSPNRTFQTSLRIRPFEV